MDKSSSRTDVVVVGGGPAGSTISAHLARLGHSVALIEAEAFPRPHVGESLAPGISPLLDRAGVLESIQRAGALRAGPALVRWASRDVEKTGPAGHHGYHVDRGAFDRVLLLEAHDAGVRVIQPARAMSPRKVGQNDWQIRVVSNAGETVVRAAFIVDACGRLGILPGRKRRLAPPTLALYAYWRDVPGASSGSLIEAGKDHWFWAAHLPDDLWNLAIFVAPTTLRNDSGPEGTYHRLLADSTALEIFSRGRRISRVKVCDASPRVDHEPVGKDWIKVGEACFACDPLPAQGVQAAMSQGFLGASVVHTMLTQPNSADLAIRFFEERIRASVNHHDRYATELYREHHQVCPTQFWAERSAARRHSRSPNASTDAPPGLDEVLILSPETEIGSVPVLQSDLVVAASAVHHPSLDHPVAYLGAVPIAPLLAVFLRPVTVGAVLREWSVRLTPSRAAATLAWLWTQGIVESARGEDSPRGSPAAETGH